MTISLAQKERVLGALVYGLRGQLGRDVLIARQAKASALPANPAVDRLHELIRRAEGDDWSEDLLRDARRELALIRSMLNVPIDGSDPPVSAAEIVSDGERIERTISATGSPLDVHRFRARLARIMTQVCQIEYADTGGTGFLVGPDLILTNYHVADGILTGPPGLHREVTVRFHHRMRGGALREEPQDHRLAQRGWRVAESPPSPHDWKPDPKPEATHDELDYALLRVEGAPGEERGFIEAPADGYPFGPGTPLLIVQHLPDRPLQVATQSNSVVGVNRTGTRVRYLNYTEPGASGAPCFDSEWRLVALHHSGDPSFRAEYNEGIPIAAIRASLPAAALAAVGWG